MASELIALSAVIADIYDAAINPALWQQTLSRICVYVGGTSAALYWHDAATERSDVFHMVNEPPEYTRLYFEKYASMNPMFPAATFFDEGVVSGTVEIMPRAEFEAKAQQLQAMMGAIGGPQGPEGEPGAPEAPE